MEATRSKIKKKKKKKWLRITLSILLLLAVSGGVYFYNVYSDVAKAVDKMNKPLNREVSKKRAEKVQFKEKDPISILLVGVDERKGDKGRTDSMLVITVNPKTNTTKLLSIPRDTRTKLINTSNPSKDHFDKINAAYAYGGIDESIDTVENFLNVPIDYYIKVNMESFKDIVNAVGGIDVDNKYAFELDGVTLKTGPQHLNGIQALEYARMRHQDPRGDFGRQERQREVISKIIQKGKSFTTLTHYDEILTALENNITTNLTIDDIIGIQKDYKEAAKSIESLDVKGDGKTLSGIWYYVVDDEERQNLSDIMRETLGLPSQPVAKIYSNTETTSTNSSNSNSANRSSNNTNTNSSVKQSTSSNNSTTTNNRGTTTNRVSN